MAESIIGGRGQSSAGEAQSQTRSVLVIGLDPEASSMLSFCLQQKGYAVMEATDNCDPVAAAHRSQPAAILLDLDMQQAEGFAVLQQLRGHTRAHVIALSRSADESRKLHAFDRGANDYMVRPFSMLELEARLRAAIRFAPSSPSPTEIFHSGELSVDLCSRIVKVGNRFVSLTATEFSLLSLFVRNAGRVLTHAQILREIWGPKMLNRLEYLRVYLKSLRQKIEINPDMPQLLLTIRSVGYRMATTQD